MIFQNFGQTSTSPVSNSCTEHQPKIYPTFTKIFQKTSLIKILKFGSVRVWEVYLEMHSTDMFMGEQ